MSKPTDNESLELLEKAGPDIQRHIRELAQERDLSPLDALRKWQDEMSAGFSIPKEGKKTRGWIDPKNGGFW